MGGVGLAASISAMEQASGRQLLWSNAQYLSFAVPGASRRDRGRSRRRGTQRYPGECCRPLARARRAARSGSAGGPCRHGIGATAYDGPRQSTRRLSADCARLPGGEGPQLGHREAKSFSRRGEGKGRPLDLSEPYPRTRPRTARDPRGSPSGMSAANLWSQQSRQHAATPRVGRLSLVLSCARQFRGCRQVSFTAGASCSPETARSSLRQAKAVSFLDNEASGRSRTCAIAKGESSLLSMKESSTGSGGAATGREGSDDDTR